MTLGIINVLLFSYFLLWWLLGVLFDLQFLFFFRVGNRCFCVSLGNKVSHRYGIVRVLY